MGKWLAIAAIGVFLFSAIQRDAVAIEIEFDYRYDSGYISNNAEAVATLEAAADFFAPLADQMPAIVPGTVYNEGTSAEFRDEWTATLTNPATNGDASIDDLTIAANTMYIFIGSRDLDDLSTTTLGAGAAGGFSASGVPSFVETISKRGQENVDGPNATDYAKWGGSIAFDTTHNGQPRNWNWDANVLPAPGQVDFLSTAIHEILHVMGFAFGTDLSGTPNNSFATMIDAENNQFIGTNSQAVYGGPVPLEESMVGRPSHWDGGVTSVRVDGVVEQRTLMTPNVAPGERQVATLLDYAAMADIGWEVPDSILDVTVLPGDYNFNGVVDAADYTVWRDGLGSDFIADDYDVWADQFGEMASGGEAAAAVAAVPEPGAFALAYLAITTVATAHRRRRRSRAAGW